MNLISFSIFVTIWLFQLFELDITKYLIDVLAVQDWILFILAWFLCNHKIGVLENSLYR